MTITTAVGRSLSTQDGCVWLRRHGGLEAFVWGGRCMRIDENSVADGGLTITTRQDPRGGVERDRTHSELPGMAEGTVTMKRQMYDRNKTTMRKCMWDVDKRIHCDGMDRDAWNKWLEITRVCAAKFTERSQSGTTWEEGEDAMINFPYSGFDEVDIYRVQGSAGASVASKDYRILDVHTCMPDQCAGACDDQEDCVLVAVTEDDLSNSYLLVNRYGGLHSQWTAVTLTAFGAEDANAVICVGYFVVALSTGDTSIIVSDDLGTTQVNIDENNVTDWAANPPVCIDAIDQTFVLIGGQNGYIYASYDGARTWETVENGQATANNITEIAICPSNPQVIYAATSAADVIIKSTNGGRSWYAVTATGLAGTGITALCVIDENTVLVGTDAGEIWQTTDGGDSWSEQSDLPVTTKATADIVDIVRAACGVLYLLVSDTDETEYQIYRNVDGGAEGKWYVPDDIEVLADELTAIACCDANHAVAVGGTAATSSLAVLVQ